MFCPTAINILLLAFAKDNEPTQQLGNYSENYLHHHMASLNLLVGMMELVSMRCNIIKWAANCCGMRRNGGNGDLDPSQPGSATGLCPQELIACRNHSEAALGKAGSPPAPQMRPQAPEQLGETPNDQAIAPYLEQQLPLRKQLPVTLRLRPSVPSWGSGLIHAVTNVWSCSCK